MNLSPKNVAMFILAAIIGITFFQNIEPVPVHFLFWTFHFSKLLLNLIFLVIGLIVGLLWGSGKEKKPF